MMTTIERLHAISESMQAQGKAQTSKNEETQGLFGEIFRSAIENVKQTDAEKTEAEYLLATGQLDNPAALTIASTKSQIAVEMLVQLRNKTLEAYSEITRINL